MERKGKKYIITRAELQKNLCPNFMSANNRESLNVYGQKNGNYTVCDSIYCNYRGGLSSIYGDISNGSDGKVVIDVSCGVGCTAERVVSIPKVRVEIDDKDKRVWSEAEVRRVKLAGSR
jgi:hypothetical protein